MKNISKVFNELHESLVKFSDYMAYFWTAKLVGYSYSTLYTTDILRSKISDLISQFITSMIMNGLST